GAARAPAPAVRAAAAPERAFAEAAVAPAAPAGSDLPWGKILLAGGLAVAALLYFRSKSASQTTTQRYANTAGPAGPAGTPAMGAGYPQYANAGGAPFGGAAAAPGGGIGSGIMGGLATGAAVGAGIVAGEALMHHFTDSNRGNDAHRPAPNADPAPAPLFSNDVPPSNYDMGGDDFGVADPGSWDSGGGDSGGGGGGGDEWN
ncbi:MAG: hypothetical protein QFF03_23965, partial [Pseudomonadota bacterium]|nr:hypothetical protein [Pseudomonadota bacterium]